MLKKALFPGKYLQGQGALNELTSLITLFGNRGMILASPTAHTILQKSGLNHHGNPLAAERFGGECCEKELTRLSAIIRENRADVLVGMGGGKTIDTAKIAADRAGIPVIILPTIASSDAPCSGCAVVYTENGVFETAVYQKSSPAAVLVDTDIIAKAPVRFLVAGMGDALATWFEAKSCSETQSPNECGGLGTMTGLALARLCYDTLLRYGPEAKIAAERQTVTPALENIVEANILLSGIGFESGGLASAHSIHNGLTALEETHAYYHGEKVAFGLLAGLLLTGSPPGEVETVYAFCENVGLPTTLADIGVLETGHGRLMAAAEKASSPREFIHHEPVTVTPETVLEAILAADAIGKQRKIATA
ncbi:MAG: glycerol dehydrogenase [Chlorobiaceae bacterium]|nr:glycerol dehydrogenase [Chlorobiaceae bacterium]